jgi:peptide/nickel transport system permease protein
VSLVVLVTASFLMIHLIPGDPIRAELGSRTPASVVIARDHALGLDKPLWTQYVDYIHNLLSGHWGTSFVSQLPVLPQIGQLISPTLELALYAFVVAILLAVSSGVLMAILTRDDRHQAAELSFTSSTIVLSAIPDFLFAVGAVYVFGVWLNWLPIAGRGGFASYILPVLSLAVGPAATLARVVRLEMLATLRTDYVRTARAKRLPAWSVYLRHALPNALTATLTMSGMLLTGLAAGTVLVETIFSWPGLGSAIVSSITAKDYPMIQAIILVYGVGILAINLVVDVALALLDPRSALRES